MNQQFLLRGGGKPHHVANELGEPVPAVGPPEAVPDDLNPSFEKRFGVGNALVSVERIADVLRDALSERPVRFADVGDSEGGMNVNGPQVNARKVVDGASRKYSTAIRKRRKWASSEKFVFRPCRIPSCSGGGRWPRRAAPTAQAAIAEALVNNRAAVVQAAGNNSSRREARSQTQPFRDDPKVDVEVVKRSDDIKGFKVLPRRWVVERTFG